MILTQKVIRAFALILMLVATTTGFTADKTPSGTVSIDETQFGLIVGGSTGGGVLTFQGEEHAFKIGGLSFGTIGVAKVQAAGEAYDLDDLSKFEGTYTNWEANIALAGGAGGLRLKNQNGVILRLKSKTQGVQLKLGLDGLKISLK